MGENDHLGMSVVTAVGAAFMLSLMNMISKLMSVVHDPIEITFWRNAVALILLVPFVLAMRQGYLLKTQRWKAQLLRAFVGTVGMIAFVWAFSLLTLTEVIALGFTAPLFVVLLSGPVLKESVGWRRVVATLIGFCGILLFTGLNGEGISSGLGLCVALFAAFMNACVILSLRWLGETERSTTTVFYFLIYGLIGCGLFMPWAATMPTADSLWHIPAIGAVGLLSLMLKTESYRRGAAALVAPLSYTLIIWAVMLDWLVWGELPAIGTIGGAILIVSSNLFIIYREHTLKKAIMPRAPLG